MHIAKALAYRCFLKTKIIVFSVVFILLLTLTILFFLLSPIINLSSSVQQILATTAILALWIFPLILIGLIVKDYRIFITNKKQILESELLIFKQISNKNVWDLINKKGYRTSVWSTKKTDLEKIIFLLEANVKKIKEKLK